jgi:hypothetical protein
MIRRARQFTMMVTDEELEMLTRVADADGRSKADVVREFIRAKHAARFGDAPVAGAEVRAG